MKVLYITLENLSLHKGSVVHVKEVVAGLRRRGHRVGLVASSFASVENADGFYNLECASPTLRKRLRLRKQPYVISSLRLFVYLFKILPRYDLIYARDFHTVLIALIPRLLYRKKLIYEINGIASEEMQLRGKTLGNRIAVSLLRVAEGIAVKSSEKIISVTLQISSHLKEEHNSPNQKIAVVGNGVNTEEFRPLSKEGRVDVWRREFGIAPGDRIVMFVGNIARWQGVEMLVDVAFRILNKEQGVKFIIVGDGVLKDGLAKRVSESCYERSILFTGMVDYSIVPELINLADICVAPFISRRNEKTGVSPLKVFEYMACGKPVIASRIEGLEFLESEGAGRLTTPGDTVSLEQSLRELLENPEERLNLGRRGLSLVRGRFDWEKRVTEIENVLRELA
jgi:glycosyltransferase involved in cell wall biosynthesis